MKNQSENNAQLFWPAYSVTFGYDSQLVLKAGDTNGVG
jgi:hypothetical protein